MESTDVVTPEESLGEFLIRTYDGSMPWKNRVSYGIYKCERCDCEMKQYTMYNGKLEWACPREKCYDVWHEKHKDYFEKVRTGHINIVCTEPERVLKWIGISKKFYSSTLDSFNGQDKYVEACRKYVERPDHSLLFTGNCGAGKTHLAVAIMRELCKQGKNCLRFVSAPELMLKLRDSFRNDACESENKIIYKFSNIGFLVIDDLGAEKVSDYSIASLYLIIDRRVREMLPTIITTNLNLEEIEEKLSPRIASRLAEYRVWKFPLQDYRKKRDNKNNQP